MDVGQRILNSGCNGDILILGRGSRHAWRHGDKRLEPGGPDSLKPPQTEAI